MRIQWFPGHMTKAIRMMEENLRLVDAVVYVIDARAVASCLNPLFEKLIAGKPALFVFNKSDLVDPADLDAWRAEFARQGRICVTAAAALGDCRNIVSGLKAVAEAKIARYREKGASVNLRAMVVGVPNSGKSTLINAVCGRAKTVTGDRPGVTRGKQWVSVGGVDMLDTPGTLWGKFEDERVALHLAYIGSIRDEVVDAGDLALEFCRELAPVAPEAFEARYGISPVPEDPLALIEEIALARGCRARGGEPDYERASRLLIDDFRKGRLGKIMLEKPESGLLRLKTRT